MERDEAKTQNWPCFSLLTKRQMIYLFLDKSTSSRKEKTMSSFDFVEVRDGQRKENWWEEKVIIIEDGGLRGKKKTRRI